MTITAYPVQGGSVTGSGSYPACSSQQILATPISGWAFSGWSDGNAQNPRTITVPAGNSTYMARFINCAYALNATATNVSAQAGSGSVGVTAGSVCEWMATANQSWLHTSSSGIGSGTVSYMVDANLAFAARTGTISIAGMTFTITQAATTDTVNDGIPDWWRQNYFGEDGMSTNELSCATCDPDGDGMINQHEFLAGTDPTNSASAFRITGTTIEGSDIRVTWATAGGRTNVLQAATAVGGSYSNVSPTIILPGSGDTTTNWLDTGAVTNCPSRFYKIKLVP